MVTFFIVSKSLISQTGLERDIANLVAPTLEDMGYELVRVSVLGKEVPTIQIMADKADGSLISIEDCEAISHAVGAVMDVEDPLPGAWNLEVSSAGIDRPLVRLKDWQRFAGHIAKVELELPIEGRKRFRGYIYSVEDQQVSLRLDNGETVSFLFPNLRKARLVLTDDLIEASSRMVGVKKN
ncbi:ribosome maturation factor RimP [Entomobacter blattae]|uniref:Ribosome maturation factor RimP n=1 Tax=Entomobacter blattae TaxID=2762277 RepID=A0A7H1NPK1_9PROT|nr:ribosome maturation factor RimP [Entomobacter blattae]QNT77711.1 Ribosome maturation factor RimP [Entomobacter blattae]